MRTDMICVRAGIVQDFVGRGLNTCLSQLMVSDIEVPETDVEVNNPHSRITPRVAVD